MKKRGFTLIELLVVISIIGVLASVVLVSVNNAREKARDSRRMTDIKQISQALQLYYDDNDHYPGESWCDSSIGTCGVNCPCDPAGSDWLATSGIHTALVGGGYLTDLPIDPVNNSDYFYDYEPECNQGRCPSPSGCCYFSVTARLEQGGNYRLEGY